MSKPSKWVLASTFPIRLIGNYGPCCKSLDIEEDAKQIATAGGRALTAVIDALDYAAVNDYIDGSESDRPH